MATDQLPIDAISNLIWSRGGRVISPRGAKEFRFEMPATKAAGTKVDLELLGYEPQFVSRDLRVSSSEILEVLVYCLPLRK
jgi:hypothetical protein